MLRYLVVLMAATATESVAANWRPPDRLLSAIRFVESSHGRFTYGDEGRSLGDFQMSEAAWLDVSAWRKSKGQRTYAYRRYVYDPKISRIYAADYLTIIHGELSKKLKRAPSSPELYAAYNMGLASFAECRYQLARVNPLTARKCQQIRELMKAR